MFSQHFISFSIAPILTRTRDCSRITNANGVSERTSKFDRALRLIERREIIRKACYALLQQGKPLAAIIRNAETVKADFPS
jgi:hypothetical protein